MEPLSNGAVASAPSHQPISEFDVRFHDTLASGDRLWIRGRVRVTCDGVNGHSEKQTWWKPWRKNGERVPPLCLQTTIAGQQLQTELSVRADGHFEGLLTAPLPAARRGWRIARNRVALNGNAVEACNVVLAPPEPATTVLVILPIEMTLASNGSGLLTGTLGTWEVQTKLQWLRRSAGHCLSVHYVALVPADSAMQRPDIAIAVTALGWPAGNLLLLPSERSDASNALVTCVDRMRWLLGGTHDLWVLPIESELSISTDTLLERHNDRATVHDLRDTNGIELAATPGRRVCARPTRAGLLPRHPVVFCHGMLGYSMLKLHRPAEINYFTALRGFLDPRGVHMLFPTVGPTSGIVERAEQLRDQIVRWTDEPVNIVAHSMGGLDARYMISHLGMADRVRSLTSIATPHRGSFMADWFQANFRHRVPLLLALEAVGFNVNGFGDCRPAHCAKFNADTPNAANVRYFSHGGDVPPARLTPFLRRAWGLLTPVEGPNDGLVSVKSARWGEYLGTIQADHFAQTPDGIFVRDGEDFDALGFYVRLVEDLARRGF